MTDADIKREAREVACKHNCAINPMADAIVALCIRVRDEQREGDAKVAVEHLSNYENNLSPSSVAAAIRKGKE